ncbi:MAG: primosomal protein N' [Gammaproteobacteria bacterium]|nr:MAG: primosomal protein N' [Gammaproteobacteria bacterium]
MSKPLILKVAVAVPLLRVFDYTLPGTLASGGIQPGCRVEVPFGRKRLIGMVVELTDHSELDLARLKPACRLIDKEPILPRDLLDLLSWAADYYQHPPGEVMATALPNLLRQGQPPSSKGEVQWRLTEQDASRLDQAVKRAPRQAALLQILQQQGGALTASQLNQQSDNWRPAMQALKDKGLVSRHEQPCLGSTTTETLAPPPLNLEQSTAFSCIRDHFGRFQAFLLQGITGSGKTEVYLALTEALLQQGRQVLVLVPEISLTPQLTRRFEHRLKTPIAALHSALNDRERLCAWTMAAEGKAGVVIGTRSALFTPMPDLGLIIIDEEHDASLKQQEGFRYHARDLALVRARNAGIPIVLGSATPSLESLHNAHRGLYQQVHLTQRASSEASLPRVELLDVRSRPMEDGLADILLQHIRRHLQQDGQVLLFLNRRGYAPLLMCHNCGWNTDCPRCDAHMTYHQQQRRLQCHHCGHERKAPEICPQCHEPGLYIPGAGTERIELALQRHFAEMEISRIDRDTTRRKGSLQHKLEQARQGQARILIGTQMLAKGHDFPNVSLVGILDIDQGLYSNDFRGTEHMAQLIVQVAGRAGRAQKPGEVLIQTHHPDHPLLQSLLHQGYDGFARAALAEREQAGFPPFAHMALLRCEAPQRDQTMAFLREAAGLIHPDSRSSVEVFGPLPAPMERRAGRFRAQLVLQAAERKALHRLLRFWVKKVAELKLASRVRWSLDVDPVDMY